MIRFSKVLASLFLLIGSILATYGYFTQGDPMYVVSLGLNINLLWGSVLLGVGTIFGFASLVPNADL